MVVVVVVVDDVVVVVVIIAVVMIRIRMLLLPIRGRIELSALRRRLRRRRRRLQRRGRQDRIDGITRRRVIRLLEERLPQCLHPFYYFFIDLDTLVTSVTSVSLQNTRKN